MNKSVENLKLFLTQLSEQATVIEKACLKYGEIKARLQLEIYSVMQKEDNDSKKVAMIIAEIVSEMGNVDDTVKSQKTKFFKERK